MSSVYLVEDLFLKGATWALKELNLDYVPSADQASAVSLFRREAAILTKLNHPGLPRIIDTFQEPSGNLYIVMECIKGEALEQIVGLRARPLRPQEAIPIALQAAHVLEYLHSQNPPVVYRDLKPSNIILSDSGRLRFIDFGIARYFNPAKVQDTQELGTPGFCAPEQYHGHSTPQSDIYALGVTLYYLLTLKSPKSFQFNFPPISQFVTVPKQLTALLESCLQISPDDRCASAAKMLHELESSLHAISYQNDSSTSPLSKALSALGKHTLRVPNVSLSRVLDFWRNTILTIFGPKSKRSI